MMMRAALLLPVATAATPWEHVGPRNIFDDENMNGEAGTLADAASPAANPDLIYAGGRNNGASPGVLKSTDMGRHWVKASNGLLDTRINAIFLHPGESDGSHVLVGTGSGVWQSTSGGASWAHVNGTAAYGQVTSFALGRIGGAEHILASTAAGIANIPVTPDGEWAVINSTYGHDPHQLSVAVDGDTTVLAMCPCWAAVKPCPAYGGSVVLGTITSPTSADWRAFPALTCHVTAIDPNDKTHFIYSNGSVTGEIPIWESRDGGKTVHDLHHPTAAFHVAIDQQGWLYTAAQAGAYFSQTQGQTWNAYVAKFHTASGGNTSRIPHDYQGISLDFGGGGVAFPSDQGLAIKPPGTATTLVNACGDMANSIVLSAAISAGGGSHQATDTGTASAPPYIVTTMWDWAPLNSWNGGKDWGAGHCWADLPDAPPPSSAIQSAVLGAPQAAGAHSYRGVAENLAPPPPPCGNCTSVKNFWFVDTPLNVTVAIPPQVLQAQDCCKLCNARQECKAVIYSKNKAWHNTSWANFTCTLYSTISKTAPQPAGYHAGQTFFKPNVKPPAGIPKCGGGLGGVGEGGQAYSFGLSNQVVVWHHDRFWHSANGGRNFTSGTVPGAKGIGMDPVYFRRPGSGFEPAGTLFNPVLRLPSSSSSLAHANVTDTTVDGQRWALLPDCDGMFNYGGEHHVNLKPGRSAGNLTYLGQVHPGTEVAECEALCGARPDCRQFTVTTANRTNTLPPPKGFALTCYGRNDSLWEPVCKSSCRGITAGWRGAVAPPPPPPAAPPQRYLLTSTNFGANWSDWGEAILLPPFAQDCLHGNCGLAADPTSPTLWLTTGSSQTLKTGCLSKSTDSGKTFTACDSAQIAKQQAAGLASVGSELIIKDSQTMIMASRINNATMLRTQDGGTSWHTLPSTSSLIPWQVSGSYSWTGKTLVVSGGDASRPAQGKQAAFVFKSTDDGDSWMDETADLAVMKVNGGRWFGSDWYVASSGEGLLVKRNFDG